MFKEYEWTSIEASGNLGNDIIVWCHLKEGTEEEINASAIKLRLTPETMKELSDFIRGFLPTKK